MDVLIVGAGVAGLAAAAELSAAGVNTHIIEARDRIGGRIWTSHVGSPSMPVELGAEFIHGRPPDLLDIAATAGLAVQPMSGRHEYRRGGQPFDAGETWQEVNRLFDRLGDPDLPDQTFSEFLGHCDASAEVRKLALNYVEGFNAARADRIGTRSLAFEAQAQAAISGDEAFRVEEGYDRLPQWLWQHCGPRTELSLSTVVEKIEWRRSHVTVAARTVSGGSVTTNADRAIITLPLGVLQLHEAERGAVGFQPRPAGLDDALRKLEMGDAVRTTLILDASFWREYRELGDAGFILTDNGVFPTWWETLRGPSRGLTAWAAGPKAESVSGLSNEEVKEQAIDSLARTVNVRRETVASQVESWHLHNWRNDPFARGAYSYARVGGLDAREQLARPVEHTLYFAGEATNTEGHGATVHGALASGRRSAAHILGRSQSAHR